jgi:hypothetical protein
MNRLVARLVTASFLAAAATHAHAQSEDVLADKKFRLVLNGAFGAGELAFSESRPFTLYLEPTTLDVQYEEQAGPGLDLGLQFNLVRHLGVLAGFSSVNRDGTGSYSTALPHPLYFNRPRSVSGSINALKYSETAGHLDLAVTGAAGAFEFTAFAGATFFQVKADVADAIQYSQAYPYDTVTATSLPTKTLSDSPIGFNAGARLDFGFGKTRRFGLAAQARFSRATVKLVPTEGSSLSFDAGGLLASAGIRVAF